MGRCVSAIPERRRRGIFVAPENQTHLQPQRGDIFVGARLLTSRAWHVKAQRRRLARISLRRASARQALAPPNLRKMPLLTELGSFFVRVFYKDTAPTALKTSGCGPENFIRPTRRLADMV